MLSLTCQSLSCLSPVEALVCTKLRLLPDDSEEKTRLVTFKKMAFFLYKLNKLLLPLIVTSVFIMLKYITRNCQQFVINVSMRDHVTFFLPRFFFFFLFVQK